jgi:GAF domain-containing protein
VRDVTQDARFSANSIAAQAGVRFYCGVPLIAPNGHRLGVLSFASREPRPDFDAASVSVAGNLAELVARELAREVAAAMKARASEGARLRSEREASAPVLVVERVAEDETEAGGSSARWVVRHANGAWDEGKWRRRQQMEERRAPPAPTLRRRRRPVAGPV